MRVALLFDGVSASATAPDLLILDTVAAIETSLADDGHEVQRIPVIADARWMERVRRGRFDLVFNLCEGIDGVATCESAVVGALELFGVPFTGSSSWTTSLCLRKHAVNALLHEAGLPIPPFAVARPGHRMPKVGFPCICKPAAEDASLGVEQRSIVRTRQQLADRLGAMHEIWREVLVQRYVDGREMNVGIVGDTVLPIAEIDFAGFPRGLWKIVTYRSKWDSGCDEDLGAVPRCPAPIDEALAERISAVAREAWQLVGGEGYGRVDLRIDREGRPWVLEVNANPDLSADAGLARMARVAGLEYPALIRLICDHALSRPSASHEARWARMQELSGATIDQGEEQAARRAARQ